MSARQIVIDTETTGLEYVQGHRIIEIGCVELINRRLTGQKFHCYINPEREVDAESLEIHGIDNEFLEDKPVFADIADDFYEFVKGAELIAHNASFDVGFLNYELKLNCPHLKEISNYCKIFDTLKLARKLHPGQRNSLDALCKRYNIDNSHRELHGALLDAEILALVYLAMTGGQTSLFGEQNMLQTENQKTQKKSRSANRLPLAVIKADEKEIAAHEKFLKLLDKSSGNNCQFKTDITRRTENA